MSKSEFTSFLCENCHIEIEASADMIGVETECPACGKKIIVPDIACDDGITRHAQDEAEKTRTQAIKSRTIRIELGDL